MDVTQLGGKNLGWVEGAWLDGKGHSGVEGTWLGRSFLDNDMDLVYNRPTPAERNRVREGC